MTKYKVQVVMSYWQTIEVDAIDEVEAAATALDLFDVTQAREGEGEVYDVETIQDEESELETGQDLAQFYGPSVRI
jgi:hypothetical protein